MESWNIKADLGQGLPNENFLSSLPYALCSMRYAYEL